MVGSLVCVVLFFFIFIPILCIAVEDGKKSDERWEELGKRYQLQIDNEEKQLIANRFVEVMKKRGFQTKGDG